MASENGKTTDQGTASEQQKPIEAQIIGQFIKDLSFESPRFGKLLEGPGDNPNLKIDVNVEASRLGPELYESGIAFKALASNKDGTIYDLEVIYAELFRLRNIPDQALEPFLLVNCPTLVFPFLRRLVADLTREGGFPPLVLDPIDFGQLYMRRQGAGQETAVNAPAKPN